MAESLIPKEQIRFIAHKYLQEKCRWSWFNDLLLFWAPRKPQMAFKTVELAAQYVLSRYKYKNDPLLGLLDHHINPNRLQAQLETGAIAVPWQAFDCDKVAAWMFWTIRNHPDVKSARLLTIACSINPDPTQILNQANWGHHTLCGIDFKDGRKAILDTNGLHFLPNLHEDTICAYWTKIYEGLGYKYLVLLDAPFPW